MKRNRQIEDRFRDNRDALPEYRDYIFDQRDPLIRDLSYGQRGNVGDNGCGAVAVHNAMKYIGKEQSFCEVLRDMEELRMTWLGAKFGTKPGSLGRYFNRNNIPYKKYKSTNDFKAALLTHKIGIVCTWNKRFYGMHFYCVRYAAEDNAYYTANCITQGNEFKPIDLGVISNARFITGYMILE